MNPGVLSVRYSRVVFVGMLFALVGGTIAYLNIGRLEDPEFTIKEALIITPYPGATAEEVAKEVTNPIESACQQLGQLRRVESESTRGMSIVTASIQDRYHRDAIPQVWDELRRKVSDVQSQLPPAVRGNSMVVDDFGDVFGVFLAVTGEGYTQPELRRYAEFLRRELLLAPNVKSVELFGEQQEVVFLEISRQRLSQLGINEEQIYSHLQARNVAADGGRVRVGDEHIALDPKGGFRSADDMLDLVIGSDKSGRQLFLRDVATLQRGNQDPPRRLLRYGGQPAVGIGISTIQGGNVVKMGAAVRQKLDELKKDQPIGIEIGAINFQPEAVSLATNDFMFNLGKAVTIVFVVLLIAMGRKTGLIIGVVLFLTIMATFFVMYMKGDLLMERISLGALIIALCMLTDNAIIIIEGIKVGIESGKDKLEVVRDVVAQNQWPLFGATAIGIIAFAAIGLSEDRTGEYCNSLFWVIFISLSLSWVSSITVTPLLSYLMFKPLTGSGAAASNDPYGGFFFRTFRRILETALRFRWLVIATSLILFVLSLYGFTKIDQSFFPPATRPQFMVDVFLPAGTHIRESESFAETVEKYIKAQPGVTNVTSFIGGGGLRFLLVYSPEKENRAFVQFLVDVDDPNKMDALIADIQKHLDEQNPNANAVAKKFLLGPGQGGRIQVRFQGPDPAVLRQLGAQATKILEDDGGAVCVRGDWREREKVIRPDLLELQARRNGITRVEVAQALGTSFEGRVVGFYREPGGAGSGIFPQETRLLPIVARPPRGEREDVRIINSLHIWSPVAGRMIPLNQVTSGTEVVWEDPIVLRRDRFQTLTVHADPRTGLPSQLLGRVQPLIEQIELPPGYSLAWGGEFEDARDARIALARPLPLALALMMIIVVCLFNSVRTTLLVWLIVPLAIIGVTAGLLITGQPFGFMALLGVLALGGEQIKNSIVVLSKIRTELDQGKSQLEAIIYGCVSKVRPVLMVAITTVLGSIPLLKDPFFGTMAVCIMFGLSFACVLTLIVMPALYTIFYGVDTHKATTLTGGIGIKSCVSKRSAAGAMSETSKPPQTRFQKLLGFVERAGNKVPHPAVLFCLLIVVVILLSQMLHWAGVSVSYQRINPDTHAAEFTTTVVNSLLAADGIRFIFTSVVPNFINFGPVGIILVAMIGIGLAEQSGLIQALIRKIVLVAPPSTITAIVVTLGLLSSIASDAGYLVLIPLGAVAYHSLRRNPLAGLAAAFAGVAAAFGANFFVKPIDGILAEMTNDAIHMVDPTKSLDLMANFYFGIASSVVLIVVCTVVSIWIVEPRLGKYEGDSPVDESQGLSADESKGLLCAFFALIAFVALISLLTLPAGAPLRNPETGAIVGRSPFMDSLVFLIMLMFLVTGIAYGVGAKTMRSAENMIDAITKTLADLGPLMFLFFVISQFVAYFNYSNMGTVLAVTIADSLKNANLNSVTLLIAFLVIGLLMSIPVPNILPKWAILAPVFIPLFLKLGIAPDAVLAAYRVSDSPPNVINPLLPHFALVVGFAQRWQKDAGVGTVVAMMLPYAAATFIAWSLLFFAWFLLGIPFGPH